MPHLYKSISLYASAKGTEENSASRLYAARRRGHFQYTSRITVLSRCHQTSFHCMTDEAYDLAKDKEKEIVTLDLHYLLEYCETGRIRSFK